MIQFFHRSHPCQFNPYQQKKPLAERVRSLYYTGTMPYTYGYITIKFPRGFRETTDNLGPFKYRIVRFYFKFLDINNVALCIILHYIAKGNNKVSIAYFMWFTNLVFF